MDEENVDTLCFPCHQKWGGDEREYYKIFKIDQLGYVAFQNLLMRSNGHANKLKIRKWAKEVYKDKLTQLNK